MIRTAAIPSSREFQVTEAEKAFAEKGAVEATAADGHPAETVKVVVFASA